MLTIFLYSLIPAAFVIFGGAIGFKWRPSASAVSCAQHFAAGIVIAAVCVDLMPKLLDMHSIVAISVGFIAGVALMLSLRLFFGEEEDDGKISMSFIIAIVVDVAIDGLLIGVSFAVSANSALLISIAFAFEVLFLTITTIAMMKSAKLNKAKIYGMTILIAFSILAGASIGGAFLQFLTGPVLAAVVGFGVAALLYLVIEELMKEAHEAKDNPWITSLFFVGFFIIMLVDKLLLH